MSGKSAGNRAFKKIKHFMLIWFCLLPSATTRPGSGIIPPHSVSSAEKGTEKWQEAAIRHLILGSFSQKSIHLTVFARKNSIAVNNTSLLKPHLFPCPIC
jgi:hypothetical protein